CSHRLRSWLRRLASPAGTILAQPYPPSDLRLTRHGRSPGCGRFAFNFYALRNIARLAHRNLKTITTTTLHKFRGGDTFFSRRKHDIRSRRLAQHTKLFMKAASDGGTRRKQEKW